MKKLFLLAVGMLLITDIGAQSVKTVNQTSLNRSKPVCIKQSSIAPMREMKMATPDELTRLKTAPRRDSSVTPFYPRPAGAFHSPLVAIDDEGMYSFVDNQFLLTKPFSDYTFHGSVEGDSGGNFNYYWEYWVNGEYYTLFNNIDLTYTTFLMTDDAPIFHVYNGDFDDPSSDSCQYQMITRSYDYSDSEPVVKDEIPIQILSIVNSSMFYNEEDMEFMLSSKTMNSGGRYGNYAGYLFTYYSGAKAYGNNTYGWWFGKNGQHIDGMAQAFEKPSHPYLLKNVYLQTDANRMTVNGVVKLTCKVYKLDDIPAYQENGYVTLPEVPGELVAYGEANVTTETVDPKNGLIKFELYEDDEDGISHDYTPTIDYPILICIDGYNDPEAAGLADFTAFISSDMDVDEGYGELAYLKYGLKDDNGNYNGEYEWRGLNNFFSGPVQMKTGLTIFIGIENPFLVYYYDLEDGEYTFPNEGGELSKTFEYDGGSITCDGIWLYSSYPSDEDAVNVFNTVDYSDIPSWLNIQFQDIETDELGTIVNATVIAEPLPTGCSYREATIRFYIPGDYIDYKIQQGGHQKGDVNHDGIVNIKDVTGLINYLLANGGDICIDCADFNEDSIINIKDVTSIINYLLTGI